MTPPLHVSSSAGAGAALGILQVVILGAYILAQVLLVLYSSHRYLVLWRWWSARRRGVAPCPARHEPPSDWPRVTVQLPVYNERFVIERLIEAAASLDYPSDRLEIQVLDDSTDETAALAARAVARHKALGVDIHHLTRPCRSGFKAGALAAGLLRAKGEMIALFDADFLPSPDFLKRMVPHLRDPEVGMVQARWGHLNRDRSLLTSAQATMLDAHFLLEHETRQAGGLFFNFNGTAGVWRRACIQDSGGWSDDTLTEDLDLSYRAQLKGWRFRYASDVVAPAELPAEIGALKGQQSRWAKGSIQTARKLLTVVLTGPRPRRLRIEAFVHLTANGAYPLLLGLGLMLLPVLLGQPTTRAWLLWTVQVAVWVFGVAPTLLFLGVGQRLSGVGWVRMTRNVAAAVVLGVGLSFNNTRAVLEGLAGPVGRWSRTPKTGDRGERGARGRGYAGSAGLAGAAELALAGYFAGVAAFAGRRGYEQAVPFLLLLVVGFSWVAAASAGARLRRLVA